MVDLTAMIWQRKRLENEERRKKDLERFLKRKEEQMKREEKRRGLEENLTGVSVWPMPRSQILPSVLELGNAEYWLRSLSTGQMLQGT